jgi:hypothetical protein
MSREYYVIRGGRVVYAPGHYDLEGATTLAKNESNRYKRSSVHVVKVIQTYTGVPNGLRGEEDE